MCYVCVGECESVYLLHRIEHSRKISFASFVDFALVKY